MMLVRLDSFLIFNFGYVNIYLPSRWLIGEYALISVGMHSL